MTNENKVVVGVVGLVVCFYIGVFTPWIWLGWLILFFFLLVAPGKQKTIPPVPVAQSATANQVSHSDVLSQLEAMRDGESDEKVKEGLKRAIELISSQQLYYETAVPVGAQQVYLPAHVQVTAAELEEQKKRQELRNINTVLYTASFLLVGAAALFIGFNQLASPVVKFITLFVVFVLFYGSGLALHKRSVRLQPAAVAFVGTGLALIPFVGLALNLFILHHSSLAWWLTSLAGMMAFLVAVKEIKSTIMAYLTLAFVFSLATSTASVLDAPFVWYFVSIIVASSMLMYLAFKAPNRVPLSFRIPLEQNAQIATPLALIGSLFMIGTFSTFDYVMISGIGALHYLVNTLGYATDKTRFGYWTAARGLVVVFASTLVYYFANDWHWVGLVILISAVLTNTYSIRAIAHDKREELWLWLSQVLIVASLGFWIDDMARVSATLVVLLAISGWQLYVLRRSEFALAGLIAALALPITVLRGVMVPPVEYDTIAILSLLIAAGSLGLRLLVNKRHEAFKQVATIFYGSFLAEVIVLAALPSHWLAFGTLVSLASLILYAASYVERQPAVFLGANLTLAVGAFPLFGEVFHSYDWAPVWLGAVLGTIWYSLSWFHRRAQAVNLDDETRAIIFAASGIVILVFTGLIAMFETDSTVIAGVTLGLAAAFFIAQEGMARKQIAFYEIALYLLTFCLQRAVGYLYPDTNWLIYTHWWAIVGGIAALLQYQRTKRRELALARSILSLIVLSLPTGIMALTDSNYQLLFLFDHVILMLGGLTFSKKLAIQWGAIGIGLAVLYMLQGYTYVLLTIVAFGLIGFAVWRLNKKT